MAPVYADVSNNPLSEGEQEMNGNRKCIGKWNRPMIGSAMVALSLLLSLCGLSPVLALEVWTLTETRRVLRDEPAGEGREVHLAAARGEAESFQILMRSAEGAGAMELFAEALDGPGGAALPADAITLYRQHQLYLDIGTHRNDDFVPGWYPDPLIPFRHPLSGEPLAGARLVAIPFDLPADQTHGFWVDVAVPRDAVAGIYQGRLRLTAAGREAVKIPLSVEVWDFELPRVSSMRTAFGSPAQRMRGYYRERARQGVEAEPDDWAAVERQCAELLSRHRINATPPAELFVPQRMDDGSFHIPDDQIAAFRDFVDRYHVNAFSVRHPRTAVKDPVAQQQTLQAYLAAFDAAIERLDRPGIDYFIYLIDEPNDEEAYRYVQVWGQAIRQVGSQLQVMVTEQTYTDNPAWGELHGAVDIWCPLFSLFREESARKRLALGETIWTYTALCQREPTPWWHIDYPLLNYRVPAWIAWRYDITGLLYWGGMSYWQQVEDPWTDPKTLDRRNRRADGRGPLFNGEGTLVYPGRAVGYDGIASSLRLKALRDAIEDYEYLAILDRQGQGEQAREIVLALASSWFDWQRDPAAYETARRRLAELILAGRTSNDAVGPAR